MAVCGVKGCGKSLRKDNKSGVCSSCAHRRLDRGDTWKPPAASAAAAPRLSAARPPPADARPVDPALLRDEDLVACVRELVHRREKIEREAGERIRAIEEALRALPGAAAAARETGT